MNRREFLNTAGRCACLLALTGCTAFRNEGQRTVKPDGSALKPAPPALAPGWDISVCGLNCAQCDLLRQEKCAGCRGPIEKNWSGNCEFRACAQAKGLRGCFECADLPCDKLRAFAADQYAHHRITVENLKRIREEGLEAWIARQDKVMFCPGWIK